MAPVTARCRDFLTILGWGLGALISVGCATNAAGAHSQPPNILFVIVDDPGYFDFNFGAQKPCPTPNVDSIAHNGVRFTDAYATCFVCSPSRAAMLTARYQNRFGFEFNPGGHTLVADSYGLPTSEVTIGQFLKDAGYYTGYVGKWHVGYRPEMHPQERGFDEFFGFLGGRKTTFTARYSLWTPSCGARNPSKRLTT